MNMEPIKCMNCETHKALYENQREVIRKMIKAMGKQELINLLQEMKIISKFPLLSDPRTTNKVKMKK